MFLHAPFWTFARRNNNLYQLRNANRECTNRAVRCAFVIPFPNKPNSQKRSSAEYFCRGDGSAPEGITGKSYKIHRKRGIELLIRKITKKEWKTWILEKYFSWKMQKHTLFFKKVCKMSKNHENSVILAKNRRTNKVESVQWKVKLKCKNWKLKSGNWKVKLESESKKVKRKK